MILKIMITYTYIDNSLYLVWNISREYFLAGIICFSRAMVRKTVSFEKQIMSKVKCTSIFSRQIKAIVFIILQISLQRVV